MPSWKKVIVSGSDAALNSLNVTNGVTGSLFGTASYSTSASQAITASYANYALTASNSQNAQDILIYVKNTSGAQIDKGKVVRISGATGDNALISTASYESDSVSANTLGITTQNIPNDSFGYVITEGTLLGINTDNFTAGQLLYLGPTGSIIGTAPQAPLHSVRLGQVLRVQLNNGSMYVRIDNGYELGELHDVLDNSTTSSYGDLLVKSGNVWTNSRQLTGSYGLTGSLQATSFTGSLFGTSSYATSASQAISSSFAVNTSSSLFAVSSSRSISSSFATIASSSLFATSASQATSASFAINASSSLFAVSSSRSISSSFATNAFIATSAIDATYATNTINVGVTNTTTGTGPYYLTFVDSTTGNTYINVDSSTLTYNATTNTITAGTFSGALSGNATTATSATSATSASFAINASSSLFATTAGTATTATNATNVAVTDTTSGTGPYYLMFADGTTGNRATRVDSSTLTFNATTNTLTVTNLTGTASYATSASQAISSSRAVSASFATVAQSVLGTITNASTASNITPAINGNVDNRVLTADGDGTLTGEANLTFDGTLLKVNGQFEQGDSGNDAQGTDSHAEGKGTTAIGNWSHTEGTSTIAFGASSHAEGHNTFASGTYSHAEGRYTTSSGFASHAEGSSSLASGVSSHAEGLGTFALGDYSHAEGEYTQAIGISSHAEGATTYASGSYSHAEGSSTIAFGEASHAEGDNTFAGGIASHAAGYYTSASGNYQSVIGAANQPSTNPFAFIVGNGPASVGSRSNLIYASGSRVEITGSLFVSRSDNPNKQAIYTTPGSKQEPAYAFINDDDTGMFRQTTNTVGLSGGGNIRVLVSDAELYLNPGTTTFQENILTVSNDSIPLVSKTPRASVTVGSASYAEVAQSVLGTITSASYANIASSSLFATNASSSLRAVSSSFATLAASATTAGTATTATNANNVAVTDTTTGTGPYYLMFADGTTGNRAARVDSSTLTFNATTNTLTVPNLAGTASWATTATSASYATNAQNVLGTVTNATSASRAISASHADLLDGLHATSFVLNSQTSSMNVSFADGANYADQAGTIYAQVTSSTDSSVYKIPFLKTVISTSGYYNVLQSDSSTFTYSPYKDSLQVSRIIPQLILNNSGSAASPAFSFSGDANTGMYNAAADTLGFSTGGSEKMRLYSNGSLGINNSSSPQALLHLGATNVQNTLFAGALTFTNQSGGYLTLYTPTAGASNFGYINFTSVSTSDGDSFGTSTFYCNAEEGFNVSSYASGSNPSQGTLNVTQFSAGFTANNGTNIDLLAYQNSTITVGTYTSTGGAINLLTRSTSSLYIDTSQRVGIGKTTGINAKLDINGNTIVSGTLDVTSIVETGNGSAAAPAHSFIGDTNTGMYNITADTLGFSTAGSERLRIDSTGNTGIGGSPSARLDVQASGTTQTSILGRGQDGNFRLTTRQDVSTNTDGSVIGEVGVDYTTTRNTAVRFHRGGSTTGGFISFTTNNGSERVRITSGGAMGLGITNPTNTAGRFEASNDIVAYSSSDKNWKKNIKNIDSPLEKLSQINGVEFDWIEDEPVHGNKGHDIGVIAQEIEQVLPQIVQTRESGMKAVQYDKIIPLLIESIKEQQKQIDELKQIINGYTR